MLADQLRTYAKLRRDPTRTITLRNRYAAANKRRFAELSKTLTAAIVDYDLLAIGTPRTVLGFQAKPVVPPVPTRYTFPQDAQKVEHFITYLEELEDAQVLEIIERDGRRVVSHTEWQNTYVKSGYGAGLTQADAKIAALGVPVPRFSVGLTFQAPRHADALGMLYTRNFRELQGITAAQGQVISRTLTAGMAEGIGPRQIAQNLRDVIHDIGYARSNVMARTELIRAHSEATLNRFVDYGIDTVQGFAEFATADDDKVCSQCRGIEETDHGYGEGILLIEDARGLIPVHPSCRCAWLPVVEDIEKLKVPSMFGFALMEEVYG